MFGLILEKENGIEPENLRDEGLIVMVIGDHLIIYHNNFSTIII